MIDSTSAQWADEGPGSLEEDSSASRQYRYFDVVDWFAAKADVVLFFFDPANPGTTLETLQALKGLMRWEHKLHIILNKVDTMTSFHDLARVYGTLCWNLSKMIPRKDIPRVHTTYLPIASQPSQQGDGIVYLTDKTDEFEKQREKLIEEVRQAPQRRIDNMISWLDSASRRLEMSTRVVESARQKHAYERAKHLVIQGGIVVITQGLAILDHRKRQATLPPQTRGGFMNRIYLLSPFSAAITTVGYFLGKMVRWRTNRALEWRLTEEAWEQEFRDACSGVDTPTSWKDMADAGVFQQVKNELSGVLTRHLEKKWYGWAMPLISEEESTSLVKVYSSRQEDGGLSQVADMRLSIMGAAAV